MPECPPRRALVKAPGRQVDAMVNIAQFNYRANPTNPANLTGVQSSCCGFNQDSAASRPDVPRITRGRFPRKCPKTKSG